MLPLCGPEQGSAGVVFVRRLASGWLTLTRSSDAATMPELVAMTMEPLTLNTEVAISVEGFTNVRTMGK